LDTKLPIIENHFNERETIDYKKIKKHKKKAEKNYDEEILQAGNIKLINKIPIYNYKGEKNFQ